MRILNWVQNKLNRGQEKKIVDTHSVSAHRNSIPNARKDEHIDWPEMLLAIGTLGNELKRPTENSPSSQDPPELSHEEAIELQKELAKLLTRQPNSSTDRPEKGGDGADPSDLEVDRTACNEFPTDEGEDGGLSPISKIILNKARDIVLADRHSSIIRQRPISFLLKKMFVCRRGFTPTPSLRDPIPESTIEQLLRAMLHKKIYPQNSASQSSKKSLEQKQMEKKSVEEETQDKDEDGYKWVKTDSDYIVLEM